MLDAKFLTQIKDAVGADNLIFGQAECMAYGFDNSSFQYLPDAVVWVTSVEQVQALVRACNHFNIPLVARGKGTGTTGASVPVKGGLVLSFERFNRQPLIDVKNRLCWAEPGVTNSEVQKAANSSGFFWAPDPSSAEICSIGGNISHNSAGPRAVKYGTTRDNVLGLEVVTGVGEFLKTGTQTTKGVVGYDLTRLLIGSEGTLALTTRACLMLRPLPENKTVVRLLFDSTKAAMLAVQAILASPVVPCALEFFDDVALGLMRCQGVDLLSQAESMLMLEVDGLTEHLEVQALRLIKSAKVSGFLSAKWAKTEDESKLLWSARRALSPALRSLAPRKINEDVVVPIGQLVAYTDSVKRLSVKYEITICTFGHVGNGNLHTNLLVDPSVAKQRENAELCLAELFAEVLNLGGTLSGEHGVGLAKKDFIGQELDANSLAIMRSIKNIFDPNGILNPGKWLDY